MENTKPIVQAKRLKDGAVIPFYATPGSAGCDLVAAQTVVIAPGEKVIVPTGLAFEIPEGIEMQIRPRSGISIKTDLHIFNSPGTIDSDYRGEIGVIIKNTANPEYRVIEEELVRVLTSWIKDIGGQEKFIAGSDFPVGTYIIEKGERIAQAVFAPYIQVQFVEVDELSETQRGTGGFGHTGRK